MTTPADVRECDVVATSDADHGSTCVWSAIYESTGVVEPSHGTFTSPNEMRVWLANVSHGARVTPFHFRKSLTPLHPGLGSEDRRQNVIGHVISSPAVSCPAALGNAEAADSSDRPGMASQAAAPGTKAEQRATVSDVDSELMFASV